MDASSLPLPPLTVGVWDSSSRDDDCAEDEDGEEEDEDREDGGGGDRSEAKDVRTGRMVRVVRSRLGESEKEMAVSGVEYSTLLALLAEVLRERVVSAGRLGRTGWTPSASDGSELRA